MPSLASFPCYSIAFNPKHTNQWNYSHHGPCSVEILVVRDKQTLFIALLPEFVSDLAKHMEDNVSFA